MEHKGNKRVPTNGPKKSKQELQEYFEKLPFKFAFSFAEARFFYFYDDAVKENLQYKIEENGYLAFYCVEKYVRRTPVFFIKLPLL